MESNNQTVTWFTPLKIGAIECKNRIIMAPLTRQRGNQETGVPSDLMKTYYTQRAGFGLIITECSQVSQRGSCFPGSGGIYSQEQVEGWKKIVDSVHQAGGKIILQIWHGGRATHSKINGGLEIWGPSPIAIKGLNKRANENQQVPHEMTIEEIKSVVKEFRQGAENAKKAGFDGVELHGANGYLIDEFLRDGSNKRTDLYGGSAENRCRFPLEVIDQLIEVFGKDRVGIRVSPIGRFNDMFDSNPLETYSYLLKQLNERQIAFVEIKESGHGDNVDYGNKNLPLAKDQIPDVMKGLKPFFSGVFINNDGFNPETGLQRIQAGLCDAISFGKMSINNPDLPERIKNNWPINTNYDWSTFYTPGEKGYTDLPFYKAN